MYFFHFWSFHRRILEYAGQKMLENFIEIPVGTKESIEVLLNSLIGVKPKRVFDVIKRMIAFDDFINYNSE